MKRLLALCIPAALTVCFVGQGADPAAVPASTAATKISYARHIRPILADHCFVCHGPDDKARKSGLRLDLREEALKTLESGLKAVVPGDPKASELVERVFSKTKSEQMPPANHAKQLKESDKQLFARWIEQGAEYEAHWAFSAPKRPDLPKLKQGAWPKNGIDYFVLARLEAAGLSPAPEADRATLVRRLSLDLTGLPPTPAEMDAALGDRAADWYGKVVDRLLVSPHYGERMAMHWLDAARYADTNGYQVDSERTMWPWRDWVIAAYNSNLPFDRFTIEQLAGDLLPNATIPQRVATGFNRNHRINEEGGSIPEEFRVEYVVDRIETTCTVWLALTMGCARCHDHKYDPFTQRDFYRFFAFFNNVPESGVAGGNAAPVIRVPTPEMLKRVEQLAGQIAELEKRLKQPLPEVDAAQVVWEKQQAERKTPSWLKLAAIRLAAKAGTSLKQLEDGSVLAEGKNPDTDRYTFTAPTELKHITALRLEVLPDDTLPARGPGRAVNGNAVLTNLQLGFATADKPEDAQPVKFETATASFAQQGYPVAHAIDGDPKTGWAFHPEFGKPQSGIFELAQPIKADMGGLLTVTLDFQFGQKHQLGRFRISATDSAAPRGIKDLSANIQAILALAVEQRSGPQQTELRNYFRNSVSAELKPLNAQLAGLRKARADVETRYPAAMVMQEGPARQTFVLKRGVYNQPGEKVAAGFPDTLPTAAPTGVVPNRLQLAQWLVDPAHPLTARVAVNRFWQNYFGAGLVRTTENFGMQAEWPSHPELLDWLATEFMASGGRKSPESTPWDVKALQKLIVTSATYRQSSKVTTTLLEKDPENRLFARGPRVRLPAELIRDQALAASGLLVPKVGGPPVKPYQPPGLWEELAYGPGINIYKQDKGEALYRRSMYTFWRRTVPPPGMTTFDAPSREVCTVNRSRTNTPLQALALLNDTIYVEAARRLGQRAMQEGGETSDERLTYAFRLGLGRKPSERELKVLRTGFDRHLANFRGNPEAAKKLLGVGESPVDRKLDAAELAAHTTLAGVILNLDEAITKE